MIGQHFNEIVGLFSRMKHYHIDTGIAVVEQPVDYRGLLRGKVNDPLTEFRVHSVLAPRHILAFAAYTLFGSREADVER